MDEAYATAPFGGAKQRHAQPRIADNAKRVPRSAGTRFSGVSSSMHGAKGRHANNLPASVLNEF
jgi:hypothetical protein